MTRPRFTWVVAVAIVLVTLTAAIPVVDAAVVCPDLHAAGSKSTGAGDTPLGSGDSNHTASHCDLCANPAERTAGDPLPAKQTVARMLVDTPFSPSLYIPLAPVAPPRA